MNRLAPQHDYRYRLAQLACLCVLLFAGAAQADTANTINTVNKPGDVLSKLLGGHEVGAYHALPTAGGLVAFELDGRLYVMSKNGRFLFDGRLRDTWHNGQTLDSMADIQRYALRLDLDGMGLDFSELVTVNLGTGATQATLFVAGDCPACAQAVRQANELPDDYRVRVVVIPRDDAIAGVRAIDCADTPAARRAALLALYDDQVETPSTPKICDAPMAHLTSTAMAARVIGIDRVPYIVAPDGRVSHGLPADATLAQFIGGAEDTP